MSAPVSRSGLIRRAGRHPLRRGAGLLLAASLGASLFQATQLVPAAAAATGTARAAGAPVVPVEGAPVPAPVDGQAEPPLDVVSEPATVVLPEPVDAEVAIPAAGVVPVTDSVVSVGSLKDAAGAVTAGDVQVEVLDREQAGAEVAATAIAAVRVTPEDPAASSVGVRVDFSGFAQAYGSNYASRLQLWSVPACFAVTPDEPGCGLAPLVSNRNLDAGTIEAAVPVEPADAEPADAGAAPAVGGSPAPAAQDPAAATPDFAAPTTAAAKSAGTASRMSAASSPESAAVDPAEPQAVSGGQAMVVVAAGASGSGGDFTATPLQASGSWETSPNSGNFHYEYPIAVPPAIGGDTPDLSLTYDSQAVDGRTTETNGQVSWAGQGWDLQTGFIERRFKTCRDDGQTVDDLCWGGAPYVMNINGASHDMIPVGTPTPLTEFRLRDDPGWRITRMTGGTVSTSTPELNDNDGE